MASHRPRYLSTPVSPPDQQKGPPPSSSSSATPLPAPSSSTTPHEGASPQPEDAEPSTSSSSSSSSASEKDSTQPRTDDADAIARIRAQLRELTHDAVRQTRERGDQFTVTVARTFAQLGKELNRMTGYEEIEALKRRVGEQEAKIHQARETARQAKEAYDRAVLQRAQSQREVNDLLQRKSSWTDADVSRFTTLVREDHAREQDEARAKAAAEAAEDAVEREFSELMRVILNRYHEEQAWSDKIRSASTYGSLAAIALNVVVFVLAIVLVEPWKRRRLAQTFERKVEEMSAATAAAFEGKAEELKARLDEQGKLLSLVLETVHLTSQVSNAELAALGVPPEDVAAATEPTETPATRRIPSFAPPEQELFIAATAGAVAAGLLGWLARSWFG
ncbi:hypothetical protein PYCCODRAFT_1358708 [Trametes coccinea BRFM310]|uniref:Sensitive to high expression protein 9, mitochondrial n=1 Tax=Trametes coccinea (strain BRFM310) TaxID=1353009 RepID=A0A1Y2J1E9_TRAC3|nr:hypothetical protein PYCCODRAFT_1358708 [Trametes coccinea BRFM310]